MRRPGRNPRIELAEDGTQIAFTSFQHWTEQHRARNPEEFPPQVPGLVQSVRAKLLNLKACGSEEFSSSANGKTSFAADGYAAVILEIADAYCLPADSFTRPRRPAYGNGSGRGIAD